MNKLPDRTEVLVVGAGPVGLAVAASLAGHGHDVTVVDRQAAGANTSRAAVVHARTGRRRFLYDLWGDTVNMASRMESHGTPDAIQITRSTGELLREDFVTGPLGRVEVKGKGAVETWRLVGPRGG